MEPTLSGGSIATMIGVPIILLVFVGLAVACFVTAKGENRKAFMNEFWFFTGFGSLFLFLAVVTAAATWWGMYPWKAEYHHWTPKSGVVETVDSRLIGDGNGGMSDKFVVKFQGEDQQYGVLDTRAAGLKAGDTLTITCKREWQYVGTDGYDCNFVDLKRAAK